MNNLLSKNNLQNWNKDVYHKDIYIKLTCKDNKCPVIDLITDDITNDIDETYKERPEWAFLMKDEDEL